MIALITCIALCPSFAPEQVFATKDPEKNVDFLSSQEADSLRQLAWDLHIANPTGVALLDKWKQVEKEQQSLFLQAASRGLRDQFALSELLPIVLELAIQSSSPPSRGIVDLLNAVSVTEKAIPSLQQLHLRSDWRPSASKTLLRWGVMPHDSNSRLAEDLLAQLQEGIAPKAENYPDILTLGPEFRTRLLPIICNGAGLDPTTLTSVLNMERGKWSLFDSAMIDVLLLDTFAFGEIAPNAISPPIKLLKRIWGCYLGQSLALGQQQLLEAGMQRHSQLLNKAELEAWIHDAPKSAQRLAMRFIYKNSWEYSSSLLLQDALDPSLETESRLDACKVLFRSGSKKDIQALLPLLNQNIDRALTRTLLAGWRIRPPEMIPGTLEVLLPSLRTKEASLAVEVLVLTTDRTTRIAWLKKAAALPASSAKRIMQAAWAVDPRPEILEIFWEFATSDNASSRALGMAGLRSALSEAELADGFRALLEAAKTPTELEIYLSSVRDLRSDSALEVLIDWLISPKGRNHQGSGNFASLLIEEEAAARLFQAWWEQPEGLNDTQLDWAACNLSPTLREARERLHQRINSVSDRNKTMFLSRMQDHPTPEDVFLWKEIMEDQTIDVSVRRVAAHLIFRDFSNAEDGSPSHPAEELWVSILQSSTFQLDRAWLVFVRGIAGRPLLSWRKILLSQAYQAPSKISLELVRACYLGFSDAPLPEQLPLFKEQLLELATEPGALPLTAMTRPKHQDVSRIHFEFFHLLLALKAFKPLEQEDRHLASKLLELGARFHPDRLSLFATTCTSWPLSVQAVEEILRATEGTLSYRYPPQASDKKELPVTSFTASTDFFEEFRRRYGQGDLADIQLASVAALKRWPRDRRSHLWAGWLNLSSMRAKEALRHFDKGLQVSGWLPYAQLEPRLGKAAAEATLANDLEILKMFVKNHEQSDALLKGRLIHGLLPELTSILDGDK